MVAVRWAEPTVALAETLLANAAVLATLPLPSAAMDLRQRQQEAALARLIASVTDRVGEHLSVSGPAVITALLRSRYRPLPAVDIALMAPVAVGSPWAAWLGRFVPSMMPTVRYRCANDWAELERMRKSVLAPAREEVARRATAITAAIADLPGAWALNLVHDFIEAAVAHTLGPRHVYGFLYQCYLRSPPSATAPTRDASD